MPRSVQVNSGHTNITLPNGVTYNGPVIAELTDEAFALIRSSLFDDGTLTDLGEVDVGVGPTGPPGPGVAAGGTTGQMLAKASGTDFDTHWVDDTDTDTDHMVPAGGTSGEVLAKNSDTDYDIHWVALPVDTDTLATLTDVDASAQANHFLLAFNSTSGKWEAVQDLTVRNLVTGNPGLMEVGDDFQHSGDQMGWFGHAVANRLNVTDGSTGVAATITTAGAGGVDTVTVPPVTDIASAADAIATIVEALKQNGVY